MPNKAKIPGNACEVCIYIHSSDVNTHIPKVFCNSSEACQDAKYLKEIAANPKE